MLHKHKTVRKCKKCDGDLELRVVEDIAYYKCTRCNEIYDDYEIEEDE